MVAAMSSGRTLESEPPKRPIALRRGWQRNTSVINISFNSTPEHTVQWLGQGEVKRMSSMTKEWHLLGSRDPHPRQLTPHCADHQQPASVLLLHLPRPDRLARFILPGAIRLQVGIG